MPEKFAIINLSEDVLHLLLHLPPTVEIIGLNPMFERHNALQVKIRGAGWDSPLDDSLPWGEPIARAWADLEERDGRTALDYNVPGIEPVIF